MKRVSAPCGPTSTRAMMRSVRLQLAAPPKNSVKRRTLGAPASTDAVKRAVVLAFYGCQMPAQGGGRRDAEDEVDAVGAAPVDNERAAVMAVAPDQDPCLRPVGPDCTDEAAQMRANRHAKLTP